jgi:hypothetical protein
MRALNLSFDQKRRITMLCWRYVLYITDSLFTCTSFWDTRYIFSGTINKQNDIDTKKIPSILNMNRLANILLPRYEEGKRIYDKVTNEIGALIDSVAAPNSDTRDGVSSQLICGQPLMCADEESSVIQRKWGCIALILWVLYTSNNM